MKELFVFVARQRILCIQCYTQCLLPVGKVGCWWWRRMVLGEGELSLLFSLSPPPPLFCTLCWSLNVLSNSITVGAMMFVQILYAFLNSSNLRVPIKTHAARWYIAPQWWSVCYTAAPHVPSLVTALVRALRPPCKKPKLPVAVKFHVC